MPCLRKSEAIPRKLVHFHKATNSQRSCVIGRLQEAFVDFFEDDYQFERLWKHPYIYIDRMKKYGGCIAPLFSIYVDMPKPAQIWNCYRSRLLGQILSDAGIDVIPSVVWGGEETWGWCFDGIPCESVVAVNSEGFLRERRLHGLFWDGVGYLRATKRPSRILVYGSGEIQSPREGDDMIYYTNDIIHRMRGR